MATDATGSPTPLGIPKYNTSADAPSGLGFNAAMDAIDALISARVTKPANIVSGEVPVWNGTSWDRSSITKIGTASLPDLGGKELDYAQITADVSVSGTSAAQTTVITGNAVTYDGTTNIVIEIMLAGVLNGASDSVTLELWDGATSIGATAQFSTAGSATQIQVPVRFAKRLTPSAGSHTYTLKAYRGTANGTIKAGTGAAGAVVPSFMRITKA